VTRVQELEKALRDLLMEPAEYTRAAARQALGLCSACGRDREWEGECSMCADGRRERGVVEPWRFEDAD
jgi:recombinational DNA repair protein RecR